MINCANSRHGKKYFFAYCNVEVCLIYDLNNMPLRLFLTAFAFILISASSAFAAIDVSTPYATLESTKKILSETEPDADAGIKLINFQNSSSAKPKIVFQKLVKILNAKSLVLNISKAPRAADWTDTITKQSKYQLSREFPTLYLEKVGDEWLFSSETVSTIQDIYDKLFPIETSRITNNLPDFAKEEFLGLLVWQYIGIIGCVGLSLVVYRLFAWLFGHVFISLIRRTRFNYGMDVHLKQTAKPFSMLIVNRLIATFYPILLLPANVNVVFKYAVLTFEPIFITILTYKMVDLASDVMARLAQKTDTTVDDNLVPLARKILKIIVVILGFIYVLGNLDINVTPLVAGMSIGGLAFALAAQETIKNLFGSITIFTDRPFEVGDWIVFSGIEGTVEEVGIRSTRIRTFNDSLISIPNGKLADSTIDNMGKRNYRRYKANLQIRHDTPAALAIAFSDGIREIIMASDNFSHDKCYVALNDFGAASLVIMLNVFFNVDTYELELKARTELITDILTLAEELGVRFAVPVQNVAVEDFPEKLSGKPVFERDAEKHKSIITKFIEKKSGAAKN